MRDSGALLAALCAGFFLALLFLFGADRDGRDAAPPPATPSQSADSRTTIASGSPAGHAAGSPAPPDRSTKPSVRDIELALRAAIAERAAAEAEVDRAQAAMEAAEAQLEFRVDQGERPDDLVRDAYDTLPTPFDALQDALRRLDQAQAGETALREELALARRRASGP